MDGDAQGGKISNQAAADYMNQLQAGRTCPPESNSFDLSLLTPEQAETWARDGYIILRGVVPQNVCDGMSEAVIDLFSRAETDGRSMGGHHVGDSGVIAVEEAARVDSGGAPDQRMSKLFNLHRMEPFKTFASHPQVLNAMHAILGPDVACFNSQYIFKNPGVWGQPWHQDSLYYRFDRMPQVGVWLATTRATIDNGCLFVAPGSHLEPIHEVVPDARPGANFGYMEVVDHDFSRAEPVLMAPGDVLIFHSFLMHKSNDNTADERRSALVYHYGHAATEVLGQKPATVDFMTVLQNGRPART
ncbi:MAG: phytanoyl-CoA dioxygenase family protein [Caulobacter sp.]|nr:phytanoyl-CoA dioxygenase family protein [Caulobacter sp.]